MYSYITITDERPYPFTKNETESIGRYVKCINDEEYICDIVFERLIPRCTNGLDYVFGNFGYYPGWKYDLDCIDMREIVMEWINMLNHEERNIRNVIRHIMYCMSYDNIGDKALIVGKWGSGYTQDGKAPTHWKNSKHMFTERKRTCKALRYGQCWCFSECMTTILRFLGLACRTVCGKNTLIDENLDGGIDFINELKKGDDTSMWNLINRDQINNSLDNLVNGVQEKSESWDAKSVYQAGDSYWNIHYWNEVYIQLTDEESSKLQGKISPYLFKRGSWEIIDSTPILPSISDDRFNGYKIAGPCKLNLFKSKYSSDDNDILKRNIDGNFDFERLFSSINSPYRLWSIESFVKDDNIIDIPYVYSVIYPFNRSLSCYIENKRVNHLFSMSPIILTKKYTNNIFELEDITINYIGNKDRLKKMYFSNISKFFGILYVQLVFLDKLGNVIDIERRENTIEELIQIFNLEDVRVKYPTCYIISYLIIENFNGNFCLDSEDNIENSNENEPLPVEKETKKITSNKWIAFCEYTRRDSIN